MWLSGLGVNLRTVVLEFLRLFFHALFQCNFDLANTMLGRIVSYILADGYSGLSMPSALRASYKTAVQV